MSATALTSTTIQPDAAPPVRSRRREVNVQETISIPGWIDDLESYRRWAHSDDYPRTGWVSFLDGEIWVDLSMEEFLTHNQVKFAFGLAIGNVLMSQPSGRFCGDRMLLTHEGANLSTEPDGLFFRWETLQSGRLRLVPGKEAGYMELAGTPDMIMEIVSKTSERKDQVVLRELYWKANIPEYWLVDARSDPAQFNILRHTPQGYVPTEPTDGWLPSQVLERKFRLVRQTDPLGHPQFVVEAQ
jgi:Uma2 family endonuclease